MSTTIDQWGFDMVLKLEIYKCLCATEIFKINGMNADSSDFGYQEDINPESADDYACGDMTFIGIPSTIEVLKKYNISEKEYNQIVDKLTDGLSFGNCGWCI